MPRHQQNIERLEQEHNNFSNEMGGKKINSPNTNFDQFFSASSNEKSLSYKKNSYLEEIVYLDGHSKL
jgi:hypothetical protein